MRGASGSVRDPGVLARVSLCASAAIAAAVRSPLAWILAAVFAVRLPGIGWGLPASDGWDNDGVAPRDFLAGLVETVSPGHYFTYPPVHLAILALVTAPVTIVALLRAPSLARADVIGEILKVPYMTSIAYTSRAVSLAMSIGIVWAVAKIVEELRGRRAGYCAAAVAGVNAPLTYYAHTTNLDVPYLFWGCLAVLSLVRAIARREPRRLRVWALLAALAVATKDQAYALFLVAAPAAVVLWIAVDPWATRRARAVAAEGALSGVLAAALVVAVDGAAFNPSGLRARLLFLLGPASQDYAEYTNDWLGRWDVVRDLGARFEQFYPLLFVPLAALGAAVLVRSLRREPARLVASFAPLLVGISFTVAFNCIARRTDERFALPQAVLVAVYAGVGLDAMLFGWAAVGGATARVSFTRWAARACGLGALGAALFASVDVDANLVLDPRYDAEAWLRDHVRPGDLIETYGLNVYMPRFPAGARVIRVGPDASEHRNPMPGVEEVIAPFGDAALRRPRFIVLSEGWAWRYLNIDPAAFPSHGRMLAPTQRATGTDQPATAYFHALTRGEYAPYRLAYTAWWTSESWPPVRFHASTSRAIWIFAAP